MALPGRPLCRALYKTRTTFSICRDCQNWLRNPQFTTQYRRYASRDNLPLTEKIRRKIWGTDNPPGLADPYGGPSFLEKRKLQREAARRAAAGVPDEPLDDQIDPKDQYADSTSIEQILPGQSEVQPYVEAETWDGLEHIGHLGNWRDLPPEPQDDYHSWFNSTSKLASDRRELLSCLHQSLVECLACEQAKLDPSTVLLLEPQELDSQVYSDATIEASGSLLQARFASPDEQQQLIELLTAVSEAVTGQGDPQEPAQPATSSPSPEDLSADESEAQEALYNDDYSSTADQATSAPAINIEVSHYDVADETFLAARPDLRDPLTFIILKRFAQLSGHRVPDHVLSATLTGGKSLSYLLDRMYDSVKPKPQKLAEVLMNKPDLAGLANVWVLPRRETPVDKEKEVGRWKVIEQELQDRGLPVLGKLRT